MIVKGEEYFEIVSLNESKYFSVTQGILDIVNTKTELKLISIPHLSRFKINAKGTEFGDAYDVRPALEWLKKEISNSCEE